MENYNVNVFIGYWGVLDELSKATNVWTIDDLDHLPPDKQKSLLWGYLGLKESLTIFTNSPYVLSYLTLAVKAYQLKINNENLTSIVPESAWLEHQRLHIFEFDENGNSKKLGTYHGLPTDDNYLNNCLAETNTMFDQLLEIEDNLCQLTEMSN